MSSLFVSVSRRASLGLLSIVLGLGYLPSQAQTPVQRGENVNRPQMEENNLKNVQRVLGSLTQEQRDKLRSIDEKYGLALESVSRQIVNAEAELNRLIYSNAPKESILRFHREKLLPLITKADSLKLERAIERSKVFNAEQQAILRTLYETR